MSQLALYLFGPPRLQLGEMTVEIDRRKALALLAYLAVTQRPASREMLAAFLWPDYGQTQASAYLRHSLWTLTHTLGKQLLDVSRYTVGIRPEAKLWVDVNEFQRQLDSWRLHGHAETAVCAACVAPLSNAVALYQGDFMAGFILEDSLEFEEWQRQQSEQWRRGQSDALERLVHQLSHEPQQFQQTLAYAQRWLALDPLNETAHQQLMRLYAGAGQRNLALRQYETCVQVLDEELGVSPQPETVALYEAIQQNQFAPAFAQPKGLSVVIHPPPAIQSPLGEARNGESEAPPAAKKALPTHNLPAQVTPFIGREVEMVQLGSRLRDPTCRLITLIGPGGIGKTRLALETAQTILDFANATPKFKDGVYLVPLAGVTASEFIVPAIANAIQFSLYSQRDDPERQLLNYLAAKELLLVLDNFEHLIHGVGLVTKLLQQAPGVRIMTTSRERLNVQGEWLFEVNGLTYPRAEQLQQAEEYSAVQLFVQAARRVNPTFALTSQELPAVIRICHLVEGMPLALELAASWMRLLAAGEIVSEIEQNLAILTSSLHDTPERHRSLLAVFEYSWERLTPAERDVFQRLAVFQAGFRRDAAQRVAEASLPILLKLVDKSLVRNDGGNRFYVHELLRQFAAERLATQSATETATRDRHCVYYLTFLQQRAEPLHSKELRTVVNEIIIEMENVRAAWQWAVQTGNLATLALALDGLAYFYEICGWFREGEEFFTKAATVLRTNPDAQAAELRGKLLAWLGFFSQRLGQYEQARILCQQGVAIFQAYPSQPALAFCLNNLADIARIQGHYGEARQHLEKSIAISQATGAYRLLGRALNVLGIVCGAQGEYAEAQRHFEAGLAIFEKQEDQLGLTKTLNNLGIIAYFSADYAKARGFYQRSLAINLHLANQFDTALTLNNLGLVAHKLGDYTEAIRLHQESLVAQRNVGYQLGIGITLNSLGNAFLELGNWAEAATYYYEALHHSHKIDAIPVCLAVFVGLANLYHQLGEAEKAAKLATLVHIHPSTDEEARQRASNLLGQLEAQWGATWLASIQQTVTAEQFAVFIGEALATPPAVNRPGENVAPFPAPFAVAATLR